MSQPKREFSFEKRLTAESPKQKANQMLVRAGELKALHQVWCLSVS